VSYTLEVKVNGQSLFRKEKEEVFLPFIPIESSSSNAPQLSNVRFPMQSWTHRCLGPEDQNISLRHKMKSIFNDSPEMRKPSITFTPTIYVPTSLGPGQSAPISFSIAHRTMNPADPKNPTFRLSHVRMRLRAHVDFRVATKVFGSGHEEHRKEDAGAFSYNPVKAFLPLDNTPIRLSSDFRLENFKQENSGVVADFKTYTIAVRHDLKMKMIIEHVESRQIFEAEATIPFTVLPMNASPDLPPPFTGASASVQLAGPSVEPVPAYEHPPTYDSKPIAV